MGDARSGRNHSDGARSAVAARRESIADAHISGVSYVSFGFCESVRVGAREHSGDASRGHAGQSQAEGGRTRSPTGGFQFIARVLTVVMLDLPPLTFSFVGGDRQFAEEPRGTRARIGCC